MRTKRIWLLAVVLVCGCSARNAPLSSQDRSAITNLIENENIGSITEIEPMRDGTVQVFTRVPGKGGGDLLTLAKTRTEWKILKRGAWMN
ncbi:MAG: hypothetical protein ACTHLW_11300 [Verrucomicrobiota bacterium]